MPSLTVSLFIPGSATVGNLHHLCIRRPSDAPLPPLHLHQVLLQKETEKEEAERPAQSKGCEWTNNHDSGKTRSWRNGSIHQAIIKTD